MQKNIFKILFLVICISFLNTQFAFSEDDSWDKALDVYNSDGLDRPVNAGEFQKVMKELNKLKDRTYNNQKKYKIRKGQDLPDPSTENAPVKTEKNDIVKIVNHLYFDGKILFPGFYKIACEEISGEYYIKFLQGKTPIIKVKASKTSHMNFCPDKVSCIETEIYQDKYYKVNFKTIDYAVTAYLAIVD